MQSSTIPARIPVMEAPNQYSLTRISLIGRETVKPPKKHGKTHQKPHLGHGKLIVQQQTTQVRAAQPELDCAKGHKQPGGRQEQSCHRSAVTKDGLHRTLQSGRDNPQDRTTTKGGANKDWIAPTLHSVGQGQS